jgi:hypothetical protein
MRSILVCFLVLIFSACSRDVAQPGFAPTVAAPTRVQLLPGDVTTLVGANPPRVVIRLLEVDAVHVDEQIAALIQHTRLVTPEGGLVELDVKTLGLPLARYPNSQAYDPPGIQVRPKHEISPGWHRLEVDMGALGQMKPSAVDPLVGGKVVARFNVKSEPTLRRLFVCPGLGEVRVQFSEPMQMGEGINTVSLTDGEGAELCVKELKAATLDAAGEMLAVRCETPLPNTLQIRLHDEGFASAATGKPLLGLDGNTIVRELNLETMPNAELGDPDCRMYVPGHQIPVHPVDAGTHSLKRP